MSHIPLPNETVVFELEAEPEAHPLCPTCSSKHYRYYTELAIMYCSECGFSTEDDRCS